MPTASDAREPDVGEGKLGAAARRLVAPAAQSRRFKKGDPGAHSPLGEGTFWEQFDPPAANRGAENGAVTNSGGGTRTPDTRIMIPLL